MERRTALVCTGDGRVRAAVEAAGFAVTLAPSAAEALPRLRHGAWDLVAFDGLPDRDTGAFVGGLAGKRRRDLFVLRVDERFATGDRFQSWSESADLVAHPEDLGRLGELLAAALEEKDGFYRVFREVSRTGGARLGAHA